MIRLKLWRALALAVFAAALPAHAGEVYQISTISSLLAGGYDGDSSARRGPPLSSPDNRWSNWRRRSTRCLTAPRACLRRASTAGFEPSPSAASPNNNLLIAPCPR